MTDDDIERVPERGLHHIGYWVDDLDAGMRAATDLLGVGPFKVLEHIDVGPITFNGVPAVLDHSAAFAKWGPVLLELSVVHAIEPPEYREAMQIRPGSVSHVAWTTSDLDREDKRLVGHGCALLTQSRGQGVVADWFSGGPLFAHPIEVHQPTDGVRAFWASMLGTAAAD